LAELLEEELRESSTSASDDLESFADFLLLFRILNAADIVVEELENFAPNNRISILWSWHGRGLERRTVWRIVMLETIVKMCYNSEKNKSAIARME
jgi:hypothetical protein